MTSILKADTIQDTSGNNIINENAGTITIGKSGDTINLASGATASGFGKILQVVETSTSTQVSTTGTTFVDGGLSQAITPTSASNKILIFCSYIMSQVGNSGVNSVCSIFRDSTNLDGGDLGLGRLRVDSTNIYARQTISIIDSPSTTSSITYSLKLKNYSAGGDARLHQNSTVGSLIIMEIAG